MRRQEEMTYFNIDNYRQLKKPNKMMNQDLTAHFEIYQRNKYNPLQLIKKNNKIRESWFDEDCCKERETMYFGQDRCRTSRITDDKNRKQKKYLYKAYKRLS